MPPVATCQPLVGSNFKETGLYLSLPGRSQPRDRLYGFPFIEEGESFDTADGTVHYLSAEASPSAIIADRWVVAGLQPQHAPGTGYGSMPILISWDPPLPPCLSSLLPAPTPAPSSPSASRCHAPTRSTATPTTTARSRWPTRRRRPRPSSAPASSDTWPASTCETYGVCTEAEMLGLIPTHHPPLTWQRRSPSTLFCGAWSAVGPWLAPDTRVVTWHQAAAPWWRLPLAPDRCLPARAARVSRPTGHPGLRLPATGKPQGCSNGWRLRKYTNG